ncbi:sugar O-acetyltransferase [Vibrio owensii]|uniref:sugar O-acetyltransferase n=1 Tax=Vibrio owensii TaxID=696485 RepID=UPI0005F00755|nr:sugar O-acetyltransferase [Vibrio owensii]
MDKKTMLHSQKVYFCNDEELAAMQIECLEILYDYNHTRPSESEKRGEILGRLLASVGENCYIEPPLRANWGCHTYLGDNVYANFNLTLVDDTYIYIGNSVMIGPNVTIATAGHPIDPDLRRDVAQFNMPVRIGDNVWIGANSVVLPGVTIGENSVIGAGSIVTKDIPANVVAVGNPCRVLREVGQHDKEYYFKDRKLEQNMFNG